MNAAPCPPKETLFGYVVGTIPEDEAKSIAQHLETCHECERTVQAMEGLSDTMISALRQPISRDLYVGEPECGQVLEKLRLLQIGHPESERGKPTANPPKKHPRTTTTLGDYELLKKLGQGGMGAVYKARHTRLKRGVALKVLRKECLKNEQTLARFEREMEAVGRLDHPNIVRAMDAREVDGIRFLVMEYVDGLDLSVVVARCGPLNLPDACEAIRQAALGLQCSQENGLVHRDVKPSNLMLSSEGQIKLLDLGLAHIQETEVPEGEVTGIGQIMGTPDYMSPEQCMESHTVDIRTDVYSLGCTFYYLLAGRPPYGGPEYDTPIKKVTGHIRDAVPAIQGLRPDVPKPIAALIERMLSKDLKQRVANPSEVVNALAPFCEGSKLITLLRKARADDQKKAKADEKKEEVKPSFIETGQLQASAMVDTSRDELEPDKKEKKPTGSEEFDPYHRWLGIPREEQPPNHYRLLGLALFEEDPEVIRDAAARQMAHVRTYHLGPHAELSQKILNALGVAKACLLHPQKKKAYDAALGQQPLPVTIEPIKPKVLKPTEPAAPVPQIEPVAQTFPKRPGWWRRKPSVLIGAAAGGAAFFLFLGTILYIATNKGTIKITLNDPKAHVELKIDGDVIKVTALDEPIQLRPGEHHLLVTGKGYQTKSESFTVMRGDNPVYTVELVREVPGRKPSPKDNDRIADDNSTSRLPTLVHNRLSEEERAEGWLLLFDGKTLDGWRKAGGGATYRVEDGCIIGRAGPGRNTFLCTIKHYSDFILKLELKVDVIVNTGIQIRGHERDNGVVYGYQCEVNPINRGQTGGIYDEQRRGWLAQPKEGEAVSKAFDVDGWNEFMIHAEGSSIKTWLNGVPCVDLVDEMDREGLIGLQIHAAKEGQIRWRNIRIKEIPRKMPQRWLGYTVRRNPEQSVEQIAPYTNIIMDNGWSAYGDSLIQAARRHHKKVALGFFGKWQREEFSRKGLELVRKNGDVVSAVCWHNPDWEGIDPSDLVRFGMMLHQESPPVELWCLFLAEQNQPWSSHVIPPEVDKILIDCSGVTSPERAENHSDRVFPQWGKRAAGRPILFYWTCFDRKAPGIVPKCQMGTFASCAQMVEKNGLAGLIVDNYGSDTIPNSAVEPEDVLKKTELVHEALGRLVGLQSRPELVAEVEAIAKDWGIANQQDRLGEIEQVEGWKLLFDGKTLDGWQGATGDYMIQSGNLICKGNRKEALFTKDEYSDFVMCFDFKLTLGANNGVVIRAPLEGKPSYDGMEIQILDDFADQRPGADRHYKNGALYGLLGAKHGYLKPAGEWNNQVITCSGRSLTVKLNDAEILIANLDKLVDPAVDGLPHPGLARNSGHIGFLGHKGRVEFRNIRIKYLSQPQPASITLTHDSNHDTEFSVKETQSRQEMESQSLPVQSHVPTDGSAIPSHWLGYNPGSNPASYLPEIADHTNLILTSLGYGFDDRGIQEARQHGLKVLFWVGDRESMAQFLREGIPLAKANPDVVLGVYSALPNFFDIKSSELTEFGRNIKQTMPNIEYWVSLPDSAVDSLSYQLPEEADVLVINVLDCSKVNEIHKRASDLWPRWISIAGERPVLLSWECIESQGPGLVPKCEPGVLGEVGKAVDSLNLRGALFATYGNAPWNGNTYTGISSRFELVSEIKAIAKNWGIERHAPPTTKDITPPTPINRVPPKERIGPFRLTPDERREGWKLLFNGRTLRGWQGSSKYYSSINGCLVSQFGPSPNREEGAHLYTDREYGDFILRLQYRMSSGANSGVLIRSEKIAKPSSTGLEIQILDNSSDKYAHLPQWHFNGSICYIAAAKQGYLRPLGEWNDLEVQCQGPKVAVTLNGTVILDIDLSNTADIIPEGRSHPGRQRTKGFIGFNGSASQGRVEYRNIRIKEGIKELNEKSPITKQPLESFSLLPATSRTTVCQRRPHA